MEDLGSHTENCHLTSETQLQHNMNMKILKKQKARFLRLQNIFSRNALLMPLCVLFTILSSVSIFFGTLTDHFEKIVYDLNRLEKEINKENNLTQTAINSLLNSVNSTTVEGLETTTLSNYNQSMIWGSSFRNILFPQKTTTRKEFFIYELVVNTREFALVSRRNYFSSDNSTIKYNQIYDSYSGIWRRCNNLSSK
jgi:hypothetical protein